MVSEPRRDQKREMEVQGSQSELDCLLLQVLTAGLSDSVFVALFCAAVERASCGVHKLLCSGGVPTSLTFIVLVVADGLFGFYGSEGRDELFISTRPPPTPCPRHL